MDEGTQTKLRNRLRRIAGQVNGVDRMVDEGQDCVDVLLQISAIQGALGKVSRLLLQHHVSTCISDVLAGSDESARTAKIDELLDVVERHARLDRS